jgi:hypothetical protein
VKHCSFPRVLSLALILFASTVCLSQTRDTLYFYNKSKIVGRLMKISLGRAEIDADGIGIITIKNNRIESIHATSHFFRVETANGRELQGYLMRGKTPGMVMIKILADSTEIQVQDIATLLYYGQTLKSRLTGNMSAGFSYTKSSDIGRLNFDGLLKYNTAKSTSTIEGDMIVTSDTTALDIERANFALSHLQSFAPEWGAVVVLKYQRNLELGLQRRWQEAFGVAREFFISNRQLAITTTGIAINQERNADDVERRSIEALVAVKYDFYSFISPRVTLSFAESGFIGLTETGRVRLDGDINLEYEMVTDFFISLQFYHNYDSRSPATAMPNIDYGFVAGLRYKF